MRERKIVVVKKSIVDTKKLMDIQISTTQNQVIQQDTAAKAISEEELVTNLPPPQKVDIILDKIQDDNQNVEMKDETISDECSHLEEEKVAKNYHGALQEESEIQIVTITDNNKSEGKEFFSNFGAHPGDIFIDEDLSQSSSMRGTNNPNGRPVKDYSTQEFNTKMRAFVDNVAKENGVDDPKVFLLKYCEKYDLKNKVPEAYHPENIQRRNTFLKNYRDSVQRKEKRSAMKQDGGAATGKGFTKKSVAFNFDQQDKTKAINKQLTKTRLVRNDTLDDSAIANVPIKSKNNQKKIYGHIGIKEKVKTLGRVLRNICEQRVREKPRLVRKRTLKRQLKKVADVYDLKIRELQDQLAQFKVMVDEVKGEQIAQQLKTASLDDNILKMQKENDDMFVSLVEREKVLEARIEDIHKELAATIEKRMDLFNTDVQTKFQNMTQEIKQSNEENQVKLFDKLKTMFSQNGQQYAFSPPTKHSESMDISMQRQTHTPSPLHTQPLISPFRVPLVPEEVEAWKETKQEIQAEKKKCGELSTTELSKLIYPPTQKQDSQNDTLPLCSTIEIRQALERIKPFVQFVHNMYYGNSTDKAKDIAFTTFYEQWTFNRQHNHDKYQASTGYEKQTKEYIQLIADACGFVSFWESEQGTLYVHIEAKEPLYINTIVRKIYELLEREYDEDVKMAATQHENMGETIQKGKIKEYMSDHDMKQKKGPNTGQLLDKDMEFDYGYETGKDKKKKLKQTTK